MIVSRGMKQLLMYKRWKYEDINVIMKLKKEGLKLKAIGQKFNATPNAIRKLIARNKHTQRVNNNKTQLQWYEVTKWIYKNNINIPSEYFGTQKILYINNLRIRLGLPIFQILND